MADNTENTGGETGLVMSIEDGRLKITMRRNEACAKCRACIAGMAEKEMIMSAVNNCDAKIGDTVRVELDSGAFIKSVLIMYGIPLISMLVGFFIGMWLTNIFVYINREVLGFLVGVCFLILSYGLIKKNENRFSKPRYEPKAMEIVKKRSEI